MAQYTPPPWSCICSATFRLDVMKNGTLLDEITFSKPFHFLGRDSEILCEHPSLSRRHAVFQFSRDKMFIFDLKSSWGTFVNKKKIEPEKYVELRDGDILGFGESTRTYLVVGEAQESEEENENLKEKINQIKQADIARKMHHQRQIESLRGDSWGMNLAAEDEIQAHQNMMDQQDEKTQLDEEAIESLDIEKILESGKLSEKQKSQIEKIQNLRRKLKQVMDKKSNAEKDQDLEFDDSKAQGQVRYFDKKTKEMAEHLEREEEKMKQILRDKLQNEMFDTGTVTKFKKLEDSDDDFYDRTSKAQPQKTLSYEDLRYKIQQLNNEKESLSKQFAKFEQNEQNDDEVDELDKFMVQNDQQIQKEQKQKIAKNIVRIQGEIDECKKMIGFVEPSKNIMDRAERVEAKNVEKLKESKDENTSQSIKAATTGGISATLQMIKDKIEAPKQEPKEPIPEIQIKEQDPPKPNPELSPKNYFSEIVKNAGTKNDKVDISKYQQFQKEYKSNQTFLKQKREHVPETDDDFNHKKQKTQDEEDTWLPPVNQKGDGKTSLNEKFGY